MSIMVHKANFLTFPIVLLSKYGNSLDLRRRLKSSGTSSDSYCPIGRISSNESYVDPPSHDRLRFVQTSYMVYTDQKHDGHDVVWMGSDQVQDSLSAVDIETGKIVHTCNLKNIPNEAMKNADWESLAVGPCDDTGNRCIYVGNSGNNPAEYCTDRSCNLGRKYVYIFKFPEPVISSGAATTSDVKVATLKYDFSDKGFPTNRADCESFFVDETGDNQGGKIGDLYVITKSQRIRKLSRVGKLSIDEHKDVPLGTMKSVNMLAVASLRLPLVWTDADMRRDGRLVALRDYSYIVFYSRGVDQSVADVLSGNHCSYRSKTSIGGQYQQYESVTFMGSGDVAEASECLNHKACRVRITQNTLQYTAKNGS